MKRAFLLVIAIGASLIAGSVLSFWLEDRRTDREWVRHQISRPRPLGMRS